MLQQSFTRTTRRSSAGFTLLELLVVVGIIAMLAGMLIPMVTRAYKASIRSRMQADLHTIGTALEAYKLDQRDYPRIIPSPAQQDPTINIDGAILLCWALYAPGPDVTKDGVQGDGANGPGFRQRGTNGTVYGPYIAADKIRVADIKMGGPSSNNLTAAFVDRNDNPIYYCPARPNGLSFISQTKGFIADFGGTGIVPMYDHQYFINTTDTAYPKGHILIETMMAALGDANANGAIDNGENANFTGPFILWSAGPDQNYNNPKSYVNNLAQ